MSNILDIYKAYSLERIVALNKQSLAMQYEQCGQLVALQKIAHCQHDFSADVKKSSKGT